MPSTAHDFDSESDEARSLAGVLRSVFSPEAVLLLKSSFVDFSKKYHPCPPQQVGADCEIQWFVDLLIDMAKTVEESKDTIDVDKKVTLDRVSAFRKDAVHMDESICLGDFASGKVGDQSSLEVGVRGIARGGDYSGVMAGDFGVAIAGDHSCGSAGIGGSVSLGIGGRGRVGVGGILAIDWQDGRKRRKTVGRVFGGDIKEDTWYILNKHGLFVSA